MTARELNVIFEKYEIGRVELQKPFDDSNEIHAVVIGKDGNYNTKIAINYNTFGFETENEICEDDYDKFEICDLMFYHTAWAYPNAYIDECGGGIEVAERNCGISLSGYKKYGNLESEIDLYTEQAVKMYKEPLEYQNWLLRMYLDEQTKFLEKHWDTFKKHGYWLSETNIFKRGFECCYTSELCLSFKTITGMSNIYIFQNLFTGKWTIDTRITDGSYNSNVIEQPIHFLKLNVNDLSTEEMNKFIEEKFDHTFEMDFRNKMSN